MSVQRDIDAELRFHLEARVEELVTQGLSRDAARVRALAEFGDVDAVRAGLRAIDRRTARRRRRSDVVGAFVQDFRYAARSLVRAPIVSLTIVLTLALGVGVNATMFSLLDVMYLRPPAGVADPGTLHRVFHDRPADGKDHTFWMGFDYKAYIGLVAALAPDASLAAYVGPDIRRFGRGENAPRVAVAGTSASYFDVLGVHPQRGRFYTNEEAGPGGAARVAVISDALWRARFDRADDIIGRELRLGPERFTIIGVTPPGFRGADVEVTDVWLSPASYLLTARIPTNEWWQNYRLNGFQILLRERAGAGTVAVTQRATQQLRSPGGFWRPDAAIVAALGPINMARGPRKPGSDIQVADRLAAVSFVVLVIACANVLNLLLARMANRRREIAVRLALGISRARLVRLLVAETALLALIAAIAAMIASAWGGTALRGLLMPGAEWAAPAVHWRVLLFAFVVSSIAAVAAGLGPALRSSSPNVTDALRSSSRDGLDRSRLRSVLVVTQTALSLVLLIAAALFVRSLQNAMAYDVGYSVDRVLFASARYDASDSARDAVYSRRLQELRPRLAAIPGVEGVAFTSTQPNWSISFSGPYFPDADTTRHRKPVGTVTEVTRDFFATAGIRFESGTTFPDGNAGAAPLVINHAMAQRLWPGENRVGRCVRFERADGPCATVVGVVATALVDGAFDSKTPHFYMSSDHPATAPDGIAEIVLRIDPRKLASIESSVRTLLGSQFPGAIRYTKTMSEIMSAEYRPWRLGATLFTAFGVLALIVAAIGVYSTVSYSVSRRTHEFGVRMALGARAADVLHHVLAGELKIIAIGLAVGIAIATASGQLIASLLYGVRPSDPVSVLVVAATLTATAIVAALAPALRASRVDPVTALRAE
jgi:predicted permease